MRKHFFFDTTLLILLAVMLILSSPNNGLCASCTWTKVGNWSDPSLWDCKHVPGSSDTVNIDNGTLTLDIDVTVVSLAFGAYPNINFGNHTITLSGIQPITSGSLAPDNKSTIILSDADHYVSTGTFYNLILAPLTAPRTITFTYGNTGVWGGTFLSGTDATKKVSFKSLMGGGV
ncbi:MAG TPA: hypothetical protein DCQ37_09090, partial [Desulfobacteraceae bacterium]|nr:hypothetical protein [Desulfobacteraceae bacterium]